MTVAAETQALHHGLRLAQRYQLAERLERGTLATVYRGQDLVLRRPIAVKAVPPDQISAYQASLRASARLAHPAAIGVYDALEQDGWLFVIQEYVNGRPISAYFRQGVPTARAVDLARQIASALAYAHAHGISHGDLTPPAVLVDRQANVRINNFGLPPDAAYFQRTALAVAASLAADDPTVELPATSELPSSLHATAIDPTLAAPTDDTRAAGYLLWLLLTEPVVDAAGIEQEEGMRRFRSEVPRALREVVVGTIGQSAERSIGDAQTLALTLERLGQDLASGRVNIAAPPVTPPAVLAARSAPEPSWSADDTLQGNRQLARPGAAAVRPGSQSAPPLPPRLANGTALHAYASASLETGGGPADPPVWGVAPSNGSAEHGLLDPYEGADAGAKDATHRGLPLTVVLVLGAVLFILFFLVGYFSQLGPH